MYVGQLRQTLNVQCLCFSLSSAGVRNRYAGPQQVREVLRAVDNGALAWQYSLSSTVWNHP